MDRQLDSLPSLSITPLGDPPPTSLSPTRLLCAHASHLSPKSSDTFGVGTSLQATRDAV